MYVAQTGPTILIVQPKKLAIAVALIAGFALVAADEGWAARGRGHHGGSHRSGFAARSGFSSGVPSPRAGLGLRPFTTSMPASGSSHPRHHRGRAVIFIGAPFLFWSWPYGYAYLPPPYYYGPDYLPHQNLPDVYVEKFEGTPTPDTPGEIYCPSQSAYYPEVQDCPGGWQRLFHESDAQAPAESG